MISFSTNAAAVRRLVNDAVNKQIPFALAQTLNILAQQVVQAEVANEAKVLDHPTPFTTKSVRMSRATKGSLTAKVFMMDAAARYLDPYEFGGVNVLNSQALLKPIGAVEDLNQYGNLPRNLIARLKGRSDVFIGKVKTKAGWVDGVWQRKTEEGGRALVTKVGKDGLVRVRKTAKGLNLNRNLKLLIKFENAHPVRQHLDWFGVAEKVVDDNAEQQFALALSRAMQTAK